MVSSDNGSGCDDKARRSRLGNWRSARVETSVARYDLDNSDELFA